MTFTGINPKFAIKSNFSEQKYPALQVTNYQPVSLEQEISFCLSEDSFNLLAPNNSLETEVVE